MLKLKNKSVSDNWLNQDQSESEIIQQIQLIWTNVSLTKI